MKNRTASIILALAFVFLFSACGKSPEEKLKEKTMEKAIEQSTGGKVKVDLSQDQIKIKDQHGEATVSAKGNVQIPVDFPGDVYVYPNTKVLIAQTLDGGFHLLLQSPEAPESLVNTYKEKMRSNGWKETNAISMGATGIFTYEKDNRQAMVTISQSEKDKTGIQLQVRKK
jgi:hypothetical protein